MWKVLWLFNFDALQLHGKGPDFECFLGLLYWILLVLEHLYKIMFQHVRIRRYKYPIHPHPNFLWSAFVATWHLRGKSLCAAALQLQFPIGFWALQMHRFWGFLALSSQWWCWMVASAARRRVAGEVFWPSWWHAIVVFERHDPLRCLPRLFWLQTSFSSSYSHPYSFPLARGRNRAIAAWAFWISSSAGVDWGGQGPRRCPFADSGSWLCHILGRRTQQVHAVR